MHEVQSVSTAHDNHASRDAPRPDQHHSALVQRQQANLRREHRRRNRSQRATVPRRRRQRSTTSPRERANIPRLPSDADVNVAANLHGRIPGDAAAVRRGITGSGYRRLSTDEASPRSAAPTCYAILASFLRVRHTTLTRDLK